MQFRIDQAAAPLFVGGTLVAVAAALSFALGGVARGAVVRANSTEALIEAVESARPGDVIRLAEGRYAGVVIRNAAKRKVLIESADPAKPAVFHDMVVKASSGISFKDLEFFVDPDSASSLFQVHSSKDITFDRIRVHGSLDGNPRNDKNGLLVDNSSNVRVTRSHFYELRVPLNHLGSRNLYFAENIFHDTALGGIWGGGSSDVVIAKNLFRDFYPAPDGHPDAVNFFTTGTSKAAKNIVVTENAFLRGNGLISQGIFFRDQLDRYPFEKVVISGNLIVGGMHNGIAVDGAAGLTLTDNVVAALPDAKSRIYLENAADVRMHGNRSSAYVMGPGNKRIERAGNTELGAVDDGGKAVAVDWFRKRPALVGIAKAARFELPFKEIAGAPAATRKVGSEPAVIQAAGATEIKSAPPQGRQAVNVTTLSGGKGNDRLAAGGHGGHFLDGGDGNDVLGGGRGDDILVGGAGDDTAYGGKGADEFRFSAGQIDGGSDTDRIYDLNFSEGDTLLFSGFPGGSRRISSYDDIVTATSAFAGVSVTRAGGGNDNLTLRMVDADGDQQSVVISGGWPEYLRARGEQGE